MDILHKLRNLLPFSPWEAADEIEKLRADLAEAKAETESIAEFSAQRAQSLADMSAKYYRQVNDVVALQQQLAAARAQCVALVEAGSPLRAHARLLSELLKANGQEHAHIDECIDVWQAAKQGAPSPWIQVSERLPTPDADGHFQPVLVYVASEHDVFTSNFNGVIFYYESGGYHHQSYGVTHWMPLPPLPAQEQSDG